MIRSDSSKKISDFELERYSRHVLLPEFGVDGVERLLASKVLLIGLGGLGTPVAFYLTASGIGQLGLVDFDQVEESNLSRQVIFTEADVKKDKIEVAERRLKKMNSRVKIKSYFMKVDEDLLSDLLSEYDLVIDAVDLIETKWMIHDTCLKHKQALIHAGVIGMQCQILTILPGISSCLKCFFTDPDKTEATYCAEEGVLSSLCGVAGSLQASEALRYCSFSVEERKSERKIKQLSFVNRLRQIDLVQGRFRAVDPILSTCSHYF